MDFCVIYFEYDKQITCVPTLKVKSRKLEPGLPCTVPFETETLGDDGREIINTEDYQGTIISIGQVKKKAVEMAVKGQKKLDGGEPLRNIIMEFKTAGRKRDAHGKMVQVLQELKDDESKPKTQKNQEEGKKKETQVKKKQKKQSKDTKISKSTQPESPQNSEESINRKKKHVPAEKMAEMLELLGPTQEADKPNTCIDNHTVAIPVGIIKTPDTDYKIFKNPSQSIPDREQENPPQLQTPIQLSTPLKKTKEILQSSTPRRSPRLNYLRCLNYEDISPVKFEESEVSSWDGTFVQSSQVLLNLDQQQNEQSTLAIQPLENQDLCNESGEFPLSEGVYQSRQQQTLCNLLGIAESEMQIAGNLLTRIGQTLLELSTNLRTESFPVMNHSTSSMSTSALYVTPPNDDIPNVPRAFSAPSEEIDLNQSIKKENLGMLIEDPENPQKYKDILVDKKRERQVILMAQASKKPAITLLNGILSCVFTDEEMAKSSGLGLRAPKDPSMLPLNSIKVDAVRGYVRYHSMKNNWTEPTPVQFNTAVTNKVTNVRKKINKHPGIKEARKSGDQ